MDNEKVSREQMHKSIKPTTVNVRGNEELLKQLPHERYNDQARILEMRGMAR